MGERLHNFDEAALEAFIRKIERLRAEGLSLNTLSERLRVPKSTIVDRMARHRSLVERKTH
jgi:hypothetical protein